MLTSAPHLKTTPTTGNRSPLLTLGNKTGLSNRRAGNLLTCNMLNSETRPSTALHLKVPEIKEETIGW